MREFKKFKKIPAAGALPPAADTVPASVMRPTLTNRPGDFAGRPPRVSNLL